MVRQLPKGGRMHRHRQGAVCWFALALAAPWRLALGAACVGVLGACSALYDLDGLSGGAAGVPFDAALDHGDSGSAGTVGGEGEGSEGADGGARSDGGAGGSDGGGGGDGGAQDASDAKDEPPSSDAGLVSPFVQFAFNSLPNTCSVQSSSVSASFGKPQAAGDLNVVVIGWYDSSSSIASVTDSSGNTYRLAIGPTKTQSGSTIQQALYFAPTIVAAASNVVTVTFVQSADTPDLRVLEYAGYSLIDQTSAASGTTATPSAALTTQFAGELVVAGVTTGGSFASSGPGEGSHVDPCDNFTEDQSVVGKQSVTMSATLSPYQGDSTWVIDLASFH
jgi:hypothetical protein